MHDNLMNGIIIFSPLHHTWPSSGDYKWWLLWDDNIIRKLGYFVCSVVANASSKNAIDVTLVLSGKELA